MMPIELIKTAADWAAYIARVKERAPEFDWIIRDSPKDFPCYVAVSLRIDGYKATPNFAIITKAMAQKLLAAVPPPPSGA